MLSTERSHDWVDRHRIVNLPRTVGDVDHTHVRIEDLQTFVGPGAGDADVQHREVEVRDAALPQLLREVAIARLEIARGRGIACPQRPLDRGRKRCRERLHDDDRQPQAFGRAFALREIVRVVDRNETARAPKRPHDADRTEPFQRPPLVIGERDERVVRDVGPAGHGQRTVRFERADVLPDRRVQRSVCPHAVFVLPRLP